MCNIYMGSIFSLFKYLFSSKNEEKVDNNSNNQYPEYFKYELLPGFHGDSDGGHTSEEEFEEEVDKESVGESSTSKSVKELLDTLLGGKRIKNIKKETKKKKKKKKEETKKKKKKEETKKKQKKRRNKKEKTKTIKR